jgi:hypothetical protein
MHANHRHEAIAVGRSCVQADPGVADQRIGIAPDCAKDRTNTPCSTSMSNTGFLERARLAYGGFELAMGSAP